MHFQFIGTTYSQVIISLRTPPPGLGFNPEDFTNMVSFDNISGNQLSVMMTATVEEATKGLVFSGSTSEFDIPPGYFSPHYSIFEPINIGYRDPDVEKYVLLANVVPPGEYVVCVYLYDMASSMELAHQCIPLIIFSPSPPILIYPVDDIAVLEPNTVFTWFPPAPMPPVDVSYNLKIVEILGDQSPYEAIESNPAFFTLDEIPFNSFAYTPDAAQFEFEKRYAWRVQAMSSEGFPVGENSGFSETGVFQYGSTEYRSITVIYPNAVCKGSVEDGIKMMSLDVQWIATGEFESFSVVMYENPCGTVPGPPPPTPTPTPQPTVTPGPVPPIPGPVVTPPVQPPTVTPVPGTKPKVDTPVPTGPRVPEQDTKPVPGTTIPEEPVPANVPPVDIPVPDLPGTSTEPTDWPDEPEMPLPPLPPGWVWGTSGPRWTGKHSPEPPALPPGWTWGPMRPVWYGSGHDPVARQVIAVSDFIYDVPSAPGAGNVRSYSQKIPISQYFEPGQAFAIQIYGSFTEQDGTANAYLSEAQCLRYNFSEDPELTPVPTPCPMICNIEMKEDAEPPMDGGLRKEFKLVDRKIKRDDFIPLGAEAKDYDKLEWQCIPGENCPQGTGKKTIPLTGRVKFEWEITEGEGNFVQLGCLPETRSEEGNYVIFQPPYVPIPDSGKNRKTTIITLRIIDDNESQPIDKTIIQKITIHTDRKKWETNEDHYFITVESGDYKLPVAPKPETKDSKCKPIGPVWKQDEDLKTPVEQKPKVDDNDKLVTGQWIRLFADDQRDTDLVDLQCVSDSCGPSATGKGYEDNVEWKWTITTGGDAGKFVHGSSTTERSRSVTGRYVIYEAPKELPKNKQFLDVEIEIEVYNPDPEQIVDKKPANKKFNLRIFKAGIEIERTPSDWLPEKDNFVDLKSKLKYHDGNQWQDGLAHMCRVHYFELNDVSTYKGYCTNAPDHKSSNSCFDLRLKDENQHEAFTKNTKPGKPDSRDCKDHKNYLVEARTKKPVREYDIRVHSEDYGAFGTILSHANINMFNPKKQENEKPYYYSIPRDTDDHPGGRKRKKTYTDNRVTIPRDIDENHIADHGWVATIGGARHKDPEDAEIDEDSRPKGDRYNSDGFTGHEEYRGFEVIKPEKKHVRTDLDRKDIFIHNDGKFDISLFGSATGLTVHEIEDKHFRKSDKGIQYSNFNSNTFKDYQQAGLKLVNKNLAGGLLGIAKTLKNEPSPPNWVTEVVVDERKIRNSPLVAEGFIDAENKLRSITAHELCHGININHHGDCKDPNGFNCQRSGNVSCIMRYDNLSAYASCMQLDEIEVEKNGKKIKRRVEQPGSILCTSPSGTGYNANNQCFGDCDKGRGNCLEQISVSGRDNNYPRRPPSKK